MHEGVETRPLFCNPMLAIVAMCIARNAFRDYKSIDEVLALEPPEDEQMIKLYWNPSVLDLPFFEGSDGKMETVSAFGRYLREWGFRAGYNEPLTVHDFRVEGLILTGTYTVLYSVYPTHVVCRQKLFAGHKNEAGRTP